MPLPAQHLPSALPAPHACVRGRTRARRCARRGRTGAATRARDEPWTFCARPGKTLHQYRSTTRGRNRGSAADALHCGTAALLLKQVAAPTLKGILRVAVPFPPEDQPGKMHCEMFVIQRSALSAQLRGITQRAHARKHVGARLAGAQALLDQCFLAAHTVRRRRSQVHRGARSGRAFSESAWFCSVIERATMKRRSASSASTDAASLLLSVSKRFCAR